MPIKHQLSRLEAQVEAVVEGIIANPLQPQDLALALTRALEDSVSRGHPPATDYILRLHPADLERLQKEHPNLAAELAGVVLQAAREAQLTLPRRPDVVLLPGDEMRPRSLRVVANTLSAGEMSSTQALMPSNTASSAGAPSAAPAAPQPTTPPAAPAAFLILNGARTIPLDRPVINIGRRLDNDIVIEDSRVSRIHAQIRQRFGRFMLYDLGSRSGTIVNGQRIVECVLQPGDVITLGGSQLLYGEGYISQVPTSP